MSPSTEHIRSLALAGHAGAGKTTLFEAMLHAGGALPAMGSVERGSTVSDTDPMEKARGHSIDTAIASLERHGYRIHLLDTPGYADFQGPALAALAAADTVAVVVNAAHGIEHGTRAMMAYARQRGLARVLVINRIDTDGVDLPALVDELRREFGPECLPLNLPASHGHGVLDAFFQTAGAADFSSPAQAHQQIIDQVVEVDDAVMEHYLEAGESALGANELHGALERCLRDGHLVPIVFTAARDGVGVSELLEIIERILPCPNEANPPPFHDLAGNPSAVTADASGHVIADVFKIINDPFVGKVGVFRVWQGTVRRDMPLLVDDARKPFRAAHLFRLQGREHVEVDEALPGDIAAIAKVDDIHFDAVLHDVPDDARIRLDPVPFPTPMFGLALEPAHKGQEQKLSQALARLAEEDPCFRVEHHADVNETVVSGLSDLHLKLMLERMKARYDIDVTSHPPRIAYRETIGTAAEGHFRHKKQTGGAGQFGEVFLRVEPLDRGAGFIFADETRGGTIPGQFMPAIEKGVRQAMGAGAVAGYPVQDVRVAVYDGKHHPVDSKEVAFTTAGRKAFLDAASRARPLVLEPVMTVDVTTPERYVGDVTGSLAARRAHILGTDVLRGGETQIKARVPLAELNDYATQLKSMTGGEGRYAMDFSHYEPVPPGVQRKMADAWKPGADDD